eukprot:m.208486 g.208486  ORF g.208486 m.208486 type:complete len:1858 (+) comp17133_c0_seq10:3764-9337(+)
MSLALYSPDTRVWLRDKESVWISGVVRSLSEAEKLLAVQNDRGTTVELKLEEDHSNLPPLRNPDVLVGAADLTDLSYLHEPAVLHNLHHRFVENNMIYTYCGIVLVAINPYKSVPLYSNDIIQAYSGKTMGELDPHIFAVAEDAFSCMTRHNRNQSIIVSGESGAGKTVSAKFAMRYFATVGGAEAETQIEKKVLASNPVMESIGNAKTTRNDNSSRFGKYIEIIFNQQHHIVGAEMRTYLLEKSRVVFQASTERNYHIFYQLCAAADLPELEALELSDAEEFTYTSQGGDATIENVDDADDFIKTKEALSLLGVSDDLQHQMFSVLAALLHMGNMEIKQRSRRTEDARIPDEDTHLPVAARLLGVDAKMFAKWLTHRKIQTGREIFTKPQTEEQAKRARDALAKHIYAHVFDWIVARINESLAHNVKTGMKKCIGVLDIYGFETFKVNSFEQFCINWANEKLQQQFNQHVFKLEQDEYVKEEIQWSFIDFYDNQPCIDLLEDKMGVITLLDEETKLPKGNDANWALKMYERLTERHHFVKPRISNTSFIVKHYADDVEYQCDGFMEKNKDTIFEEHLVMLRGSSLELVSEMFNSKAAKKVDIKKMTVGTQFKHSLDALMETLNTTDPHYVRCIKPNDVKQPFAFNTQRTVQQLRACGVLETIRISAAGYPSRWEYPEFQHRYRLLQQSGAKLSSELKEACREILEPLIADADKFQFGKTKIFFRAGQVAYLEKLRATKMRESMIKIQSHVRGFLQLRRYLRIRQAALAIQAYGRGLLARQYAQKLRETAAVIQLQAHFRRWQAQSQYQKIKLATTTIQRFARGLFGRREYKEVLKLSCTIRLQSFVRMWRARKTYLQQRKAAIAFQCGWRAKKARAELKQLKTEARSVAGIQARNSGLAKKVIELQQTMDRRVREAEEKQAVALESLQAQLDAVTATGNQASQSSADEIAQLREENARLQAELGTVTQERDMNGEELATLRVETTARIAALQSEATQRQAQLDQSAESASALEQAQQELNELKQANNRALRELEEEQSAHQMKLKAIMDLEAQVAELEGQLMTAEQAVLQSAHDQRSLASQNSGESLQTPEPMAAPQATDEYIEVAAAEAVDDTLLASLQAEVAALQDELLEQKGEAATSQNDALLAQLRSDLQAANLRCKQLESQAEHLKQETTTAVSTAEKLRKENKDLFAGASLSTTASSETAQEADELKAEDSPTRKAGLDHARTDIARLQLANTKLMEKANELEKAKALAEGKLARLGGNADPEGLQKEVDALIERVHGYEQQMEVMVAATALDEANEEIELLTRQLQQLQADYDSFMNRENMLDLAKAKTTLQEKNHQLAEELAAVRSRLTDAQEEIRVLTGSLADVQEEKRAIVQHKNNLEQALSKKLSSGQPNGAVDGNLLQEEVRVLIDENLAMREQVEVLEDKLKAALTDRPSAPTSPRKGSPRAASAAVRSNTVPNNTGQQAAVSESAKPSAPAYTGMLKFQEKDIQRLVGALVVKIKPEHVNQQQPHLPAHLLFMCVLYADAQANGAMLQGLLTKTMRSLKAVVTQNSTNLERLAFWLANGFRLLTNMKQFSGDPQFSTRDDPSSRSLQTFDLMEYRRVLSDLLVQIYHTVVKHVEVKLTPMIVPGLLEYESLPGGAGGNSGKSRGGQAPATIMDIFALLTDVHACLVAQNVEPRVVQSVFRQVYYNMNAVMVNTLLLRKDLARLTKGMQVRYNITKLEEWARTNKLEPVCGVLSEAVQLTQLLQCPKSSADHAETIFETCTDLNPLQIQKMLQMYSPEEYEDRVPASLLRAVSDKQNQTSVEMKLLLDTKHIFPVTFPFSPSAPRFPSVEIPSSLGLDFVEKI